jgi:putative transposase
MPSYREVEAFLNQCSAASPRRRQHHLPLVEYRCTTAAFAATLCARDRSGDPFRDARLASLIIQAVEHRRRIGIWRVYAYCLMPDHLHAVVHLRAPAPGLPAPENLLTVFGRFRSYTTHESWKLGLRGTLWQHDQFDRLLRDGEEFETRCRYVLNNPVRKGWVEDWQDWPYSGVLDEW